MTIFQTGSRTVMLAAVAAIAFSTAVSAAVTTHELTVCRTHATAAADQWSADQIVRAADAANSRPQSYVAVVYGKKYFVPLRQPGALDLHLRPIGERAIERKNVYSEELARCLGSRRLDELDYLDFYAR